MSRLVKVRMTPGKTELALWDQEPAGMLLAALGASIASAWWLPLEVVVRYNVALFASGFLAVCLLSSRIRVGITGDAVVIRRTCFGIDYRRAVSLTDIKIDVVGAGDWGEPDGPLGGVSCEIAEPAGVREWDVGPSWQAKRVAESLRSTLRAHGWVMSERTRWRPGEAMCRSGDPSPNE